MRVLVVDDEKRLAAGLKKGLTSVAKPSAPTDAGVSGSSGLENRNELSIALEALRDGIAGGLVVYRLDRLARDLVLQEQLLMEICNLGGRTFSTAGLCKRCTSRWWSASLLARRVKFQLMLDASYPPDA
jgi:Resolvase, N terminal domain